jgi:curved DNA-binding protein CbpA
MGKGLTWYDVLEVQPGASPEEIQYAYDSKASLLRPAMVAGAPTMVLDAVARGQRILDEARQVLADPGNRERYDASLRTGGTGLAESARPDLGADWMAAPHHDSARRITVPDLRGLFYSVCLDFVSRLDLRLNEVRLTEHPMPVDGLVVGQSPAPLAKAHRSSELTIQVWHPPERPQDS